MKHLFISLMLLLAGSVAYGQSAMVSGTVSSSDGDEPMIGVTVRVKNNPKVATSTDLDGHYVINAPKGSVLQFSYIGYGSAERKVDANTINVVLSPETGMLDEVVVIGYGTVKKSDLTGSVSTVNADKLTKTPAVSLSNALQGQAAGVTVNSLTGRPGAGAEVRIRGVGSINGSSPIYVVDGVIVDDIN